MRREEDHGERQIRVSEEEIAKLLGDGNEDLYHRIDEHGKVGINIPFDVDYSEEPRDFEDMGVEEKRLYLLQIIDSIALKDVVRIHYLKKYSPRRVPEVGGFAKDFVLN